MGCKVAILAQAELQRFFAASCLARPISSIMSKTCLARFVFILAAAFATGVSGQARILDSAGSISNAGLLEIRTDGAAVEFGTVCGMNLAAADKQLPVPWCGVLFRTSVTAACPLAIRSCARVGQALLWPSLCTLPGEAKRARRRRARASRTRSRVAGERGPTAGCWPRRARCWSSWGSSSGRSACCTRS